MTLSGAEVALCVIMPMFVTSLVLLVLCHLMNKQIWCFTIDEDQTLLAVDLPSRKSLSNQLANQKNSERKGSYVSMSIVNPSYTEMRAVGHVTTTSNCAAASTLRHHHKTHTSSASVVTSPQSPMASRSASIGQLSSIPETTTSSSGGCGTLKCTDVITNSTASSAAPSPGYLSLGDHHPCGTNDITVEGTSGKLLSGYGGRRRSSMQMPIDINLIDPKLYATATKPSSFDYDQAMDCDTTKPMIHMSCRYCTDNEEFMVKIIQGRNLQALDSSAVTNPYCTVELMPDYVTHTSRVHHGTCDPEFEELFRFPLLREEIDDKTLRIKICDSNPFARDECSGVMMLKLKEIDFELNCSIDMWRSVVTYNALSSGLVNNKTPSSMIGGDLMIGLTYLSSAEKLTITLQKARNLIFKHTSHLQKKPTLPDTFVKVSLFVNGNRTKKRKTNVVASNHNPEFDEALTFNVQQDHLRSRDVKMLCQVMHDAKLGNKILIGWLELGPTSTSVKERHHWLDLLSNPTPVARWHTLRRHNETSSSSSD